MSSNFINGIIWGGITFGIAMWLSSYDTTILEVLSFILYGFSGLCFLRAFRVF